MLSTASDPIEKAFVSSNRMATVKRVVDLNEFGRSDSKKRKTIGPSGECSLSLKILSSKRTQDIDLEKFAPGAIVKVRVKNFVTYALTEFTLSPSLNMIIGPNGTGKSTFVCAVCLGLAGSPTLLGRQKALAGFIKNGEQSATVEITLKNKPGHPEVVIKREFFQTNKSDWYVNGRQSSEQKIKTLLKEMNIQLDNLCQFLPQEKVADFAKLTPEKLLEETERAIEIDLLNKHKQLIELDQEKSELIEALETKSNDYDRLSEERKRFEEEARKYEAFQKKKGEFEDHERLIPYAKIQDLKVQQQVYKEERDLKKRNLEEFEELVKPYEAAASQFDDDVQNYVNQIHDKKKEHSVAAKDLESYNDELGNLETAHQKVLSHIEAYKTRAEAKKREMEKAQATLATVVETRDKLQIVDPSQIEEYKNRSTALFGEQGELNARIGDRQGELKRLKREEMDYEDRINKTKQQFKSTDRIHILDGQRGAHNSRMAGQCKKAVNLLRSAELSSFKGSVFEPPCLTLSTTRPEYAAYLEELVDAQTTYALTAVSQDVYNQISREVFEKHRINIPFRYLSNKRLDAALSKEDLNNLGFDGYLRDFVNGPKAVVQMLAETSYIHDVPVSIRGLSDNQIMNLQRPVNGQLRFRKFISGDVMYNLSISRYGSRQVTMRTSQVNMRAQKFSAGGMSDERKHQLNEMIRKCQSRLEEISISKEDIKRNIEVLNAELQPLNDEFKDCDRLLKQATHSKREFDKLTQRAESLEQKIQTLESEANRDYTKDLKKGQRKLKQYAEQRIKALANITIVQIRLNSISQEMSLLEAKKFDQENKKVSVEKLTEGISQEKEALQKEYDEAKRKYQELRSNNDRKVLIEQIKKFTDEEKERLNVLSIKYSEEGRFSEASVRDIIEGLDSELKLLGTSSKASVSSLERINNQLEELGTEIPELEMKIKQQSHTLKEIHAQWEPKLYEMVHKISSKFSSIFPSVGIAGEVRVAKAEKYSDWRLEILVKFRDEAELRVLDSQSQSGGERAVSTVFYMISMQELTTSPFRVVDEINQGMDARNEKVVHKHMVEVACQEHTSQYFLITPKLLTNLHYSEKMRIHCIMAGPWTPDPTQKPEYLSLGATSIYV